MIFNCFENGWFELSDGTPSCRWCRCNVVYFSNHFKDVVYFHTKMTPCQLVSNELNICLPQHLQIHHFDSYQHHVICYWHKWYFIRLLLQIDHVYVKQPETTPETPETHNFRVAFPANSKKFLLLILQTILRLHYKALYSFCLTDFWVSS